MLKQHLKTHGIRQAAFAEQLGVSQAYLSQLIARTRRMPLELAVKIERLTDGAVPATSWVLGADVSHPQEAAE